MLRTKITHPLCISYHSIDTAVHSPWQNHRIRKYAICITTQHDTLHQSVCLLVVKFYIYITRTGYGDARHRIKQMGTKPYCITCHIIGTIGLQIYTLLRYFGIVV